MKLNELIEHIDSFNDEHTIYVKKPWNPDSETIIAAKPVEGEIPDEAVKINAEYFLEIFLAKEFLEGWILNVNNNPSANQKCLRLIEYAKNDA